MGSVSLLYSVRYQYVFLKLLTMRRERRYILQWGITYVIILQALVSSKNDFLWMGIGCKWSIGPCKH